MHTVTIYRDMYMCIYIRRAGWGFSLICGLSQDKWPSKMGTYHWEGHQVFFNAYLQGSESSALLRGMCPSPGFGKKWDRHIPLRSYGDLRTNLWYMYILIAFGYAGFIPDMFRGSYACWFLIPRSSIYPQQIRSPRLLEETTACFSGLGIAKTHQAF